MFKEYKSKPKIIKAIKFTGSSSQYELLRKINENNGKKIFEINDYLKCVDIYTLEGIMSCYAGDYIIQGIEGEYYPCKKSIFEKSYEIIE